MNKEKETTKMCLIKTALEMLCCKSTRDITVREIAAKAGVNVASINYHFGSKEKLLEQAGAHYFQQSAELFKQLDALSAYTRQDLHVFCSRFTGLMAQYPGILKSILSEYIEELEPRQEAAAHIRLQINTLKKCIGHITGIRDENTLVFKAFQLMSSLVYPLLLKQYGSLLYDLEFDNESHREKYIDTLLESILAPVCDS